MSSIQDHNIRPIRRGTPMSDYYAGDPQTMVELAPDDEALDVYFASMVDYYSPEMVMVTGRKVDNETNC